MRAPDAGAAHGDAGLTAAALAATHPSHVEKGAAAGGGAADGGGPRPGEEVLLDENELAAGHPMLDVASVTPSPDHTLVAYAADLSGYETYQLRIRRVGGGGGSGSGGAAAVGSLLDDVIEGTNGDVEWGADNTSLYYLTMDDAHRPHKLWRHVLGTPQGDDVCLLTEDDERFWLGMHKTLTGDYIVADASSKTTSEVRLVALRGADGAPLPPAAAPAVTLVAPRRDGVLYEVEHWRQAAPAAGASAADWLVVLTNADGAKNFRVAVAPVATPGPEHWRTVIPHARSVHVTGVDVFARFWAIYGREGGYKNVWIVDAAGVGAFLASSPAVVEVDPSAPGASGAHVRLTRIPPREAVYVLGGSGGNMDYDARVLRFTYGSPVTPSCTCEYRFDAAGGGSSSGAATGMVDGDWAASVTVLKQKEVPNCNPADYATTRVFATAPVSGGSPWWRCFKERRARLGQLAAARLTINVTVTHPA